MTQSQTLSKAAYQGSRRPFHYHSDLSRGIRAEFEDGSRLSLDDSTGRELLTFPSGLTQIADDELDAQIDADAEEAWLRDQMAQAIADYAGGGR